MAITASETKSGHDNGTGPRLRSRRVDPILREQLENVRTLTFSCLPVLVYRLQYDSVDEFFST